MRAPLGKEAGNHACISGIVILARAACFWV